MEIYCYWTSCRVSFIWLPSFESFSARWIWISESVHLRRPPWLVCLVYSLPSNIFYWVLFSLYGTTGDRAKLVLNLHSWKPIYLKIIALFLSSFSCTTFLFLSLRCNISSGGEKIIRFVHFEFVLRVFFAEDFGIRIDGILLKRNFFNMLLLFFSAVARGGAGGARAPPPPPRFFFLKSKNRPV